MTIYEHGISFDGLRHRARIAGSFGAFRLACCGSLVVADPDPAKRWCIVCYPRRT